MILDLVSFVPISVTFELGKFLFYVCPHAHVPIWWALCQILTFSSAQLTPSEIQLRRIWVFTICFNLVIVSLSFFCNCLLDDNVFFYNTYNLFIVFSLYCRLDKIFGNKYNVIDLTLSRSRCFWMFSASVACIL